MGLFILIGTCGFMLLCSTAMYLVWTPKDSLSVHGLQHRYFLPVYLAVTSAVALMIGGARYLNDESESSKGKLAVRGNGYAFMVAVAIFLALFIPHIASVSIDVLKRYY